MERSEHHVRGVQRVDEVGREGVPLFHRVGFPAGEEPGGARLADGQETLNVVQICHIVKVWRVFDEPHLIPRRQGVKHCELE